MKLAARNLLLLTVVLSMLAWALPVRGATTRALFAWGTDNEFWSADVNPAISLDAPAGVLTTIRLRSPGDQLHWRNAGELAETPVSISNRGSELLVVLDDGEWKIVSESDVRSGNSLPDGGRVMALAGDGDDVWAVAGFEPGAAPAATPVTTPSNVPANTPATAPSHPKPKTRPASSAAKPLHPLELYLLHSGEWKLAGDIPADFKPEHVAAVSLAVLDRKLTLAIVGPDRVIRVFTRTGDRWNNAVEVGIFGDDAQLKLLSVRDRPALWVAEGNTAGTLYFGGDGWTRPTRIAASPKLNGFDCRSLAFSLGQLRLLATDGKGLIAEQLYQPDGTLQGDAHEAVTAPTDSQRRVWDVLQYILLAAIIAWMLGSLRQRPNVADALRKLDLLNIAPVGRRLAGGAIDLSPLIVGIVVSVFAWRSGKAAAGNVDFSSPEMLAVCCGVGLYFLHVTLSELLTGRSLGKWITGTKVVSLDGSAPRASQLLARNALRLIDLIIVGIPLLSVLQSPLRQRVGDMMAGTIVVTASPPTDTTTK